MFDWRVNMAWFRDDVSESLFKFMKWGPHAIFLKEAIVANPNGGFIAVMAGGQFGTLKKLDGWLMEALKVENSPKSLHTLQHWVRLYGETKRRGRDTKGWSTALRQLVGCLLHKTGFYTSFAVLTST